MKLMIALLLSLMTNAYAGAVPIDQLAIISEKSNGHLSAPASYREGWRGRGFRERGFRERGRFERGRRERWPRHTDVAKQIDYPSPKLAIK